MSLFRRVWERLSGAGPGPSAEPLARAAAPRDPEVRAEEVAPREPASGREVLARVEELLARGDARTAIAIGRAGFARFGDPALGERLARLHVDRGEDADALELLESDALAPRDDALELLLAEILERRGRIAEARAAYERVLARDIEQPAARDRLARLAPRETATDGGATIATAGAELGSRYRIESELGRGGAGTVFAALDVRCERRVALKVYHGRTAADRSRFETETRVPAMLEHPGILRILDADPSLLCFAAERLPHGSLRDRGRRGELGAADLAYALATALEALAVVHAAGWLHRDLKPTNLLVRADGRTVLADFGLALPLGADGRSEGRPEGTPAYAAPEQLRGEPCGPAADVRALSATFLELAREAGADLGPGLVGALERGLADEPSHRPGIETLRRALSGPAPCP
ncbi:MAG: protein kinase [Polyangiales bacterium]